MKFSIITVNYNNCEGLKRTIASVTSQNYNDFEFIVIDGGSTDGSLDVIHKNAHHIHFWVSEPDGGVYQGMNKGIQKATGDYLNFMNSGDCFFDETILGKIASKGLEGDMIVGRDYHFNTSTKKGFSTILPQRISMLTFYLQSLPHQSTFFKKELFNNSLYDENLRLVSDLKFYIQKLCVEDCSINFIDDIICRREPDGLSLSMNEQRLLEHKKVISQFLPIGAQKDYQSLSHLDKSTLYKLMQQCEHTKARIWLTYCIKIINRLFIK